MTGDELHAELCRVLGIENRHGSRKRVAERLGMSPVSYRAVASTRGRVNLGRILNHARRAGVSVLVVPEGIDPVETWQIDWPADARDL